VETGVVSPSSAYRMRARPSSLMPINTNVLRTAQNVPQQDTRPLDILEEVNEYGSGSQSSSSVRSRSLSRTRFATPVRD